MEVEHFADDVDQVEDVNGVVIEIEDIPVYVIEDEDDSSDVIEIEDDATEVMEFEHFAVDVDQVEDVAAASRGAGIANFVASAGEAAAANVDGTVGGAGAAGFVGVGAAEDEGAVGYGGPSGHHLLTQDMDGDIRQFIRTYFDVCRHMLMEYDALLDNGLPPGVDPEPIQLLQILVIASMDIYSHKLG